MPIPERLVTDLKTIAADASAREAARAMGAHHVGSLIVVDEEDEPQGLVTDRDLALHVLVGGLDAGTCPVSKCMTAPLLTIPGDSSTAEAARTMRREFVRRLPVEGADGKLVGMLASDDLVRAFGRELACLSEAIRAGYKEETAPRTKPTSRFGKE